MIEETIKVVEGNILDYDKDIIIQQVNCQGVMGGGLAKQILMRYPEVPKEYRDYWVKQINTYSSSEEFLGNVLYVNTYDGKLIANVFGQNHIRKGFGDKTVYTQEWALLKGIDEVKNKAYELGLSVAIPTFIGCGLANGDWNSIKSKIEEIFEYSGVDVTFYNYR